MDLTHSNSTFYLFSFRSLFGMDDLSGITDMDMEFSQFSRGCTIFLVPINDLTNTPLESQDP